MKKRNEGPSWLDRALVGLLFVALYFAAAFVIWLAWNWMRPDHLITYLQALGAAAFLALWEAIRWGFSEERR